jgi:hypothetical protein
MASTTQLPIIPIWLRDTYAHVQDNPIYDLQGYFEEDRISEVAAYNQLNLDSNNFEANFFLRSSDIFTYISKHQDMCDRVITIVIHGLRDVYWDNRKLLPPDEVVELELAMRQPLPVFRNIFDYKSLAGLTDRIRTPLFQLFNTITPFSVINIPVRYFIESINMNAPIQVELMGTNIILQFDYEPYDFWDFSTQKLITHIDLQCQ